MSHPFPPSKERQGDTGNPRPETRQCKLPKQPTLIPTFFTLQIDASSLKTPHQPKNNPDPWASILCFWKQGRIVDLFLFLPEVGRLSLRTGALLGLQWT